MCNSEILAYNDAIPRFRELNTVVLGEHVSNHCITMLLITRNGTFFCFAGAGISTDSKYSHFAWAAQPRKAGGLGPDLKLPLVADRNMKISQEYGVLLEEKGISLRGLFIIDPQGILRYVVHFF